MGSIFYFLCALPPIPPPPLLSLPFSFSLCLSPTDPPTNTTQPFPYQDDYVTFNCMMYSVH